MPDHRHVIAIIAGGRDLSITTDHLRWLDQCALASMVNEVVHGDAPGADRGGAAWARERGLFVTAFPADWATHGRAAGPIRNRRMAHYARDHASHDTTPQGTTIVHAECWLLPGGRGTLNMRHTAEEAGLTVRVYTP